MATMLSLTASGVARPAAVMRVAAPCPARLTSRHVNGQLLSMKSRRTHVPRRVTPGPVTVQASSAEGALEAPSGFLADKGSQKIAYGLLTVAWVIVAATKIFFTHQFFEYAFDLTQPFGEGLLGLQRLSGFSSLAPAVASYTLVKAAKGGRLDSHTYLRQNLALAIAGTITLWYLWQTPAGVLNQAARRIAGALATVTAIVGGAVYSQYSGSGFSPVKVVKGFYNSVIGLLSPDNANAAVYAFVSAALGIYSGVLLFGPHELASQWLIIGPGNASLYLQREVGLSAFLAAVQTYCLKDAADRNSLGRSTFKNLNLALAAIAAGNAATLWWAINAAQLVEWTNQSYVRMAFLALQVIVYAYNWIEADRDENEDVGRIESAFDDASDGVRKTLRKGEDKFDEAKSKAENAGEELQRYGLRAKDKAKEAGGDARSGLSRFAARAEDKAEDVQKYGLRAKDKAKEAGSEAENRARYGIRNAEEKADDAGSQAKDAARDIEDDAKQTGEQAKRKGRGFFKN